MTLQVPPDNPPTLCIVGGGFSGVAVACHLLDQLPGPARILMMDAGGQLGRGLAYGTPSPHHVLNVPAGRMGLYPDDEPGFLRYLNGLGLPFSGGDFVPRSLYGAYLESCLGQASARAFQRGIRLEFSRAKVTGLQRLEGGGWRLHLQDGAPLDAGIVVLALGNFASVPPWTRPAGEPAHPGLLPSAWARPRLNIADVSAEVLLVGCGLTAFDALLELRHQGHSGRVTMLSRRGLRAQFHRANETPPPRGVVPEDCLQGERSVRVMLRSVRALCAQAQARGQDWRDVIGGLRAHTPRLWQQLAESERRRFLRHVLPYWDSHRHRSAVSIARTIERELAEGTLKVEAGRLLEMAPNGQDIVVHIRPRGSRQTRHARFAAVINCTGSVSDLRRVEDPLIRSLVDQGLICPDSLGLGLLVNAHYQPVDQAGAPVQGVFYVGPLLKAQFWEATAVPELRTHARQLAQAVLHQLHG